MNLNCSFCGKGPKEVEHIVTGACVCICNECVDLCADIIAQDRAVYRKPKEAQQTTLQATLQELFSAVEGAGITPCRCCQGNAASCSCGRERLGYALRSAEGLLAECPAVEEQCSTPP